MILIVQSAFFDREDQALPGFSKFFRKASDEEREHAQKLIDYQNMRGGKVVFIDTENTFRPDRLRPIAARFNIDEEAVLDNVLVARAYTSEEQMELLTTVAAKVRCV